MGKQYSDSEVFCKYSKYRGSLRKRYLPLRKEKGIPIRCDVKDCPLHAPILEGDKAYWLGDPITLELDHYNGVNDDNRWENLWLLCPNCHDAQPTTGPQNRATVTGTNPSNPSRTVIDPRTGQKTLEIVCNTLNISLDKESYEKIMANLTKAKYENSVQ